MAEAELEKPFAQEEELAEKSARLAQLNLELNIDNHNGSLDEEDELIMSEDEEYEYQAELAESGIGEAELFSRKKDDAEEAAVDVGGELTEQGQETTAAERIEELLEMGYPHRVKGNEGHTATLVDAQPLNKGEAPLGIYRYPGGDCVHDLEELLHGGSIEILENARKTEEVDNVSTPVVPEIDSTEERKALSEERKAVITGAKRKLAEDGAMPIITDAMEGRAYTGEIVEIGSAYAVQKIDDGRGIIHNLSYLKDFTRVLNESKVPFLEITYDQEMNGTIGNNKSAERGRSVSMRR
jgi:hypothetical protein